MNIGELIQAYRKVNEMKGSKSHGIRAVSRSIGISHGTLSRLENGESVDGVTMVKLILWMFKEELTNGEAK